MITTAEIKKIKAKFEKLKSETIKKALKEGVDIQSAEFKENLALLELKVLEKLSINPEEYRSIEAILRAEQSDTKLAERITNLEGQVKEAVGKEVKWKDIKDRPEIPTMPVFPKSVAEMGHTDGDHKEILGNVVILSKNLSALRSEVKGSIKSAKKSLEEKLEEVRRLQHEKEHTLESHLDSELMRKIRAILENPSSGYKHGGGATVFTHLADVPASYSGQGGKGVRVNSSADGLEFYTLAGDTDEKVKLNAGDATAGYLDDKITGYGFITDLSSFDTDDLAEGSRLYFTNARAIASVLTGYTSGAGTVAATDTILQAIQKLNGNISAITAGYVSSITGTANQVIASSPTGAVTLSLPQSIATTSTPQFARMGIGAAADSVNLLTFTQPVATSGNPSGLVFTAGAHTGLTASAEVIDVNWNLARTVQRATGAVATQRAFLIQAPTYSFVGASTITTAATLAISGPPVAGTNATISSRLALWTQSGNVAFSGATVNATTFTASDSISASNTIYSYDYRAINNITVRGGSDPAGVIIHYIHTLGAVFNEQGSNIDFRVEGDTEANLLFLDADGDSSNGQVMIGTGTANAFTRLTVKGASGRTGAYISGHSTTGLIVERENDSGEIFRTQSSGTTRFFSNVSEFGAANAVLRVSNTTGALGSGSFGSEAQLRHISGSNPSAGAYVGVINFQSNHGSFPTIASIRAEYTVINGSGGPRNAALDFFYGVSDAVVLGLQLSDSGKLIHTPATITASTTNDYSLSIAQTLNDSTGGGSDVFRGIKYNLTETAVGAWANIYLMDLQVGGTSKFSVSNAGLVSAGNVYPLADNTYYLGKNDDDSPLAYKGVILKDTTDGKYYRIEVISGVVTATDLTD